MEQLVKYYMDFTRLNDDIKYKLKYLTENFQILSHNKRFELSKEITMLLEFRVKMIGGIISDS